MEPQQGSTPVSGVDLRHPYLTRHLIAYIGNKRSLLGFLAQAIGRLAEQGGGSCGGGRPAGRVFLDPFAGSGAVSRLARLMGFRVLANDWEAYSWVLNGAHLGVEAREAAALFREAGGLERVIAQLNRLEAPPEEERYIARHYAPRETGRADYRRERLFYTAENALMIDAVRGRIEALYPGFDLPPGALREKLLLLASLLYQCATHTNTSGVFKACHKGFGGHSRDALKRILSPVRLEAPVLIDAPCRAEVFRLEAAEFLRRRGGDLCYLDPPYNQHQYGSNYHLLNTIALWDRPPVDDGLRPDGRLRDKAAIRRDWTLTRSPYCYREAALPAFRRLLEAADCRWLLLSYNTEGIIPFEELVDTLAGQGRLEFATNEYVKYRGGKQSLERQVHNLELLLIVDRSRRDGGTARSRVEPLLLRKKLELLLRRSFIPQKVRGRFATEGDALVLEGKSGGGGRGPLLLPMPHLYRFEGDGGLLEALPAGELEELYRKLSACECRDKREEIQVLLALLQGDLSVRQRGAFSRRVLALLRKFAFRRYRQIFEETFTLLVRLAQEEPELFGGVGQGLSALARLARARFDG